MDYVNVKLQEKLSPAPVGWSSTFIQRGDLYAGVAEVEGEGYTAQVVQGGRSLLVQTCATLEEARRATERWCMVNMEKVTPLALIKSAVRKRLQTKEAVSLRGRAGWREARGRFNPDSGYDKPVTRYTYAEAYDKNQFYAGIRVLDRSNQGETFRVYQAHIRLWQANTPTNVRGRVLIEDYEEEREARRAVEQWCSQNVTFR